MREKGLPKTSLPVSVVLASTSQYRRELLARLRIPFTSVAPNGVDETALPDESPQQLVARLSALKAHAVAAQHPNSLIIGSDQVAWCETKILGKPHTFENACAQLAMLSGKRVTFYTGLCVLNTTTKTKHVDVIPYHVEFRELSAAMIENYVRAEQPYQCAGSFKSEGLGIALFRAMSGDDPTSLIGLPLIKLTQLLEREQCPIL